MNYEDIMLGCPYCGETLDMPSPEFIERFGGGVMECCDNKMIQIDRGKFFRIIGGLEALKENIEKEILKDF